MRSVPSVLVRVMPSGSSMKAAAQLAVRCAMPRSGSLVQILERVTGTATALELPI